MAKKVLILLLELSGADIDIKVEVKIIATRLNLDRIYMKNLLEYLENRNLLSLSSIGGPYLYGHIRITHEGIYRAKVWSKP